MPGGALGLDLAEELERLRPFGMGNPQPTLLVPAARFEHVAGMGEERQHARFTLVTAGGARSRGVAFGSPPKALGARLGAQPRHRAPPRAQPLERDGGAALILRALCPTRRGELRRARRGRARSGSGSAALEGPRRADPAWPAPPEQPSTAAATASPAWSATCSRAASRVLVAVADVPRRREGSRRSWPGSREGGMAVASWDAPRGRSRASPPGSTISWRSTRRPAAAPTRCCARGPHAHLAWGPAEVEFALLVWRAELELRPALADAFRALRELAPGATPDALERALRGDGRYPRTAALCARLLAVLRELGLVEVALDPPACRVRRRDVRGRSGALADLPRLPRAPRGDRAALAPSCPRRAAAARPEQVPPAAVALHSISCRAPRGKGSRARWTARKPPSKRSGTSTPKARRPPNAAPRSARRPASSPPPPRRPPRRGDAERQGRRRRGAAGGGEQSDREFERHPVDEHTAHAPAGPKTKLTEDQRVLLGDLFAVVEEHADEAAERVDRDLVERAFVFACERHADQRRASGEDFIVHPIGVAKICAGMRLDTATLCAALLHDTVEDTSARSTRCETEFGDEIGALVDGVTKLSGVTFQSRDDRQAENYRKMMVAMAQDIRVILIKLADRLHNMRTLGSMPKQKQQEKAKETLEIFAPLAHRLGIHAIKWELEDLAFATLHPRKYNEIKQLVASSATSARPTSRAPASTWRRSSRRSGIEADISGRAKHFYSIYSKMTKKGREFNEIYDLTAMRVIVDSVKDCYGAIGVIHSLWKPLPGRFKDWVAMPKFNMYQALHTTVIGPEGRPLEIQIRTEEMHRTAEFGVAAHWIYKEDGGKPAEEKVEWLRHLLDWQQDTKDPQEFAETLKADLFEDEVFVFTPKGEVKSLAAGATPLDFAYSIHTDVGHRCVGAKVNGKIVPLHYELESGDICEVLTSKKERGPVARLAGARQDHARAVEDPRLVQARAPRGLRAHRPRDPAREPEARRPAAAEDRRLAAARRRDPRDGLQEGRGLLHRPRPGEDLAEDGHLQADAPAEGGRGGGGAGLRGVGAARAQGDAEEDGRVVDLRHQGRGRRGRDAAAGQVLPAGAGRPDRGLHLARQGHHDPPRGLPERAGADEEPGALHQGGLGGRHLGAVPGRAPDRRLGPPPAAGGPVPHVRRDRDQHPRGALHGRAPDGEEPLRGRGGGHAGAEDLHHAAAEHRLGVRRLPRHADRLGSGWSAGRPKGVPGLWGP